MPSSGTRRRYRSPSRAAQAASTRTAVLRAARDLFTAEGYGVPVARIAERAGVAVDTVYTSVGRKPDLIRAVIDMVLADSDDPLPAEQRGYVRRIREAPTAADKIRVYADAIAGLLPVVGPLQEALKEAGATDPGCARAWRGLDERRAGNMLLFAADLRSTGELRTDLDDQHVADVVWSMNSAEYFAVLTRRGWTPERIGAHLADTWIRALLEPSG